MAAPFPATFHFYGQAVYIIVDYQPRIIINRANTHIRAGNFAPDSSITDLHTIYAFILPALLALLQIQPAGNKASPSPVHPLTTEACLLGLLGYYLAFTASLRWPQYATKLSVAMAAFGSFSSASLVTLLLPHSWWHIRYIFYALLVVIELHPLLTLLYDRYVRRSRQPNSARTRTPLLPLRHVDLREHNNIAYLMGAPA